MSGFDVSEEARQDLREIWSYIARESPDRADAFSERLREAMLKLAASPGMGHRRSDLTPHPFRFWSVGDHLIVYHESKRPLTVFRVLSARRDISAILSE
jgi:plasmid stabilization system protein ParE